MTKIELNKQTMLASFITKCPNSDYLRLYPLYNMLSEAFLNIDFKKAYVDVVPKMSMVAIDFNLGHKILLSVSKTLKTISDDTVVFSISVDGDVRYNNVAHLSELIEKVHVLQKNLTLV